MNKNPRSLVCVIPYPSNGATVERCVFSCLLVMLQYNPVFFPSGIWIVYIILPAYSSKGVFLGVFAKHNALILYRNLLLHKFACPHVELWFTDWTQ